MRHPFIAFVAIATISFFALAFGLDKSSTSFDTVRTRDGLISGIASKDGKVHIFRGIPFAAPPVGALRWRAPEPVTPWSGIRKCDSFGPSPMQDKPTPIWQFTSEFLIPEKPISEDCLYLNVWSAAKNTGERRPVLVYIFGGGFISGGSAVPIYDGESIAAKGVVFVSINYRVGIFGFFSHPGLTAESGHNASGNYGLLDQIAALRWVNENIAAFGGDPSNVTIAGQSAGSMSVNYLITSPLAKGLFTKAIAESGAAILNVPGFIQTHTLQQAEEEGSKVAAQLHASDVSALRAIPASELLKVYTPRAPIIDGYVLPAEPADIIRAHHNNPVSLLTGWTEDDWYLGQPENAEQFRKHIEQQFGSKGDSALMFYPASDDATALTSQERLTRDMLFGIQNYSWANLQSQSGRVYVYRFRRRPPANADFVKYGAFHGADIVYAYDNLAYFNRPLETVDYQLAATMSSYWANFARTGDPNNSGGANSPNTAALPSWPAYTFPGAATMILDESPHSAPLPDQAALEFLLRQTQKTSP